MVTLARFINLRCINLLKKSILVPESFCGTYNVWLNSYYELHIYRIAGFRVEKKGSILYIRGCSFEFCGAAMGNEKANNYWEAELPQDDDRRDIQSFIRAK